MAAHGARRLLRMTENLSVILGVEALCAAQGVEHRAPLTTSPALAAALEALRKTIPPITDDRVLSGDITTSATLITNDTLASAAGVTLAP
jgi:histidine ammonia-lyase